MAGCRRGCRLRRLSPQVQSGASAAHIIVTGEVRGEVGIPWLFSIALVNMLAIAKCLARYTTAATGAAFLSSCLAIIALMGLFGLETYLNLLFSNPDVEQSEHP